MNKLRPILLALTAVAALSVAYPASANTITTFNVSGTCSGLQPGFTGTTFDGTLTIDVTAGTITAIGVNFQGLTPFNTIISSEPSVSTAWHLTSLNGSHLLFLDFLTGHTPSSLVGFTGGTIVGSLVVTHGGLPVYSITGGSITAPTGSVPDGGSTLPLLGFASLGLLALRRKLRC